MAKPGNRKYEAYINEVEVANLISFLKENWKPDQSLLIVQGSCGIGVRTDVHSGGKEKDITDYDCW